MIKQNNILTYVVSLYREDNDPRRTLLTRFTTCKLMDHIDDVRETILHYNKLRALSPIVGDSISFVVETSIIYGKDSQAKYYKHPPNNAQSSGWSRFINDSS